MGHSREGVWRSACSAFLWTEGYLGKVDELLEEVRLQVGGGCLGVRQVEVAGNLGNHGRVAIVLAVPAGLTKLITMCWALDSMRVAITSTKGANISDSRQQQTPNTNSASLRACAALLCMGTGSPVVHHGRGVAPVLGHRYILESAKGGVALEAELGHKLGARVHARVQAIPRVVVIVAVAPPGVRRINAPPAPALSE